MGMKQTCWRPATLTETNKSIGKKRLYEWTERIMQLEDSVSIFTKRFTGPAKTFEPSTIGDMLGISQPSYEGIRLGIPDQIIVVVTADANGTYGKYNTPMVEVPGDILGNLDKWIREKEGEIIDSWYSVKNSAGSEEIRIDVFYLYMEPQPGIPIYVADQITDPNSFYGADAVKYAMDELFTHCHLFRINNEVPTCYEYVSSDAKGAVFYKIENRAAFENMNPNKKPRKARFKWSDIETVIPV
ncbi:MAG: hypothetical protein K6F54_11330 [Lachnospiraceae bacterium]|nr:hypothetical protein [Lachnospiraceae bacterium]